VENNDDITAVLERVRVGDKSAVGELMPLVYDELRALAGHIFEQQSPGQTLQPTAVVNEAYLKLVRGSDGDWETRAHFFAVAAKAMRQILIDHARRKKTQKRGGHFDRITLSAVPTPAREEGVDLMAVEAALEKLSALDARQAEIVELRFLAGLEVKETAHVLGVSTRTVEREWFAAKAWLRRELARHG
jgi:RNA polymerase sigma factor (TIGR02999 family)